MIQKVKQTSEHKYEVLDYITVPSRSRVDTHENVDYYTIVEIVADVAVQSSGSKRLFSTYAPGYTWNSPKTWALETSIKIWFYPLGYNGCLDAGVSASDFQGQKLRYNVTASGYLTVYDTSDNVVITQDVSQYTSSTETSENIRLFGFTRNNEYLASGSKIYYVKIWQGNTLTHHYLPVKRLSDNVYGLYDEVDNTFHPNEESGYAFTGTSKSTPEYIDENTEQTVYVKDIMLNGISINRIYNKGEIYWGNVIAHTPSEWHGIRGTANVVSATLNNAIYYNETYHNVNVDKYGNWEIEENNPIYTAAGVCRNNSITSIDFTKVIWQPNLTVSQHNWGTLDLLFRDDVSGTSGLTDIYFDFTGQDSEHMFGVSQFFGTLNNCRCHGLGTLKWSGEINMTDSTRPYKAFGLRELSNNLIGTFDIRGIDTTSITDQDQTYMDWLRTTWGYGLWYQFGRGLNCDTWIVGKFEIQSGNNMSFSYPSMNVKTLYCTSQIPPSLNRTGLTGTQCYDWLSQLSSLTNIYVPTGCLSAYQNASGWSNKASIMSEREAPDPLNI